MRVIITGAAGRIGHEMVEELSDTHELCLIDRRSVPGQASIVADLGRQPSWLCWRPRSGFKPARWTKAFAGADVVLHLAAEHRPTASWQRILHHNIQATWNVFDAAVRYGVRRMVFASSNWAVKALELAFAPECYIPAGTKIGSDAPPRPQTPYGISKAFGEIVGRSFVDDGRLDSFIAVRIGYYSPSVPRGAKQCRMWIGPRDLRRLLRRCVETECQGFHVIYGVSAQPTAPYDLSYTRRLLSWEPCQRPP